MPSTDARPGLHPGALVLPYGSSSPRLDPSVWVAPGATIVGDVSIGPDSSVFYAAVLRGDVHQIRIGARTNIQDHATLHVTAGRFPTILGDEITVGHRAVVHGCHVEDGALIGIGAIILDGARVGRDALVAAGAVVRPGQVVEAGTLVAGVPSRTVRSLSPEEIAQQRERTRRYVETARRHAESVAG